MDETTPKPKPIPVAGDRDATELAALWTVAKHSGRSFGEASFAMVARARRLGFSTEGDDGASLALAVLNTVPMLPKDDMQALADLAKVRVRRVFPMRSRRAH